MSSKNKMGLLRQIERTAGIFEARTGRIAISYEASSITRVKAAADWLGVRVTRAGSDLINEATSRNPDARPDLAPLYCSKIQHAHAREHGEQRVWMMRHWSDGIDAFLGSVVDQLAEMLALII